MLFYLIALPQGCLSVLLQSSNYQKETKYKPA